MQRDELERLSKAELIDLVLRLQRPEKTSRTSSKPPSTDRKERRERAKPGGAKPGHAGHSRPERRCLREGLHHAPSFARAAGCALARDLPGEQAGVWEQIELPAVTPQVVHHHRLAVRCPGCGTRAVAPVPVSGTPFGPRLHAVATYLKTYQALSYERLQAALADLFGLRLSQGGLMNLLRRGQGRFQAGARRPSRHCAVLRWWPPTRPACGSRAAPATTGCSAARRPWCTRPRRRRAASVVTRDDGRAPPGGLALGSLRGAAGPRLGPADLPGTPGARRGVCLEASDDPVPFRLKLWLGSAFDLAEPHHRPGRLHPGRQAAGTRAQA